MQLVKLLHNRLKKSLTGKVHQKRLTTLSVAVQGLISGADLTITDLGRYLEGDVADKHVSVRRTTH